MDNDGDLDIVVGNAGQQNAVHFNEGKGKPLTEVRFGVPTHATYGVDVADFNGDKFPDIVVANSGVGNQVFMNVPAKGKASK